MTPARRKPAFRPLRGNTAGELERTMMRFNTRIRRVARMIANGDADLAEDLYEAAMTQLWELDPARFDADDDGYLWQSMIRRMLNARRNGERPDPTRPPLALRFR